MAHNRLNRRWNGGRALPVAFSLRQADPIASHADVVSSRQEDVAFVNNLGHHDR